MKSFIDFGSLKIINCLLMVIYWAIVAKGQETPPILNFPPNTYKAENQNWDISQNEENYIYVANNQGLLEYNGAEWSLYPSPNNTIIRSVETMGDRIYTGSYMEFGYWKKNDLGSLEYHSLSEKTKTPLIEDEHFWNIESYGHWILFQSYSRIYIYDTQTGEMDFLAQKDGYYRIFKVNDEMYLHKRNEHIYKLEGGLEKLFITIPSDLEIELVLNIFQEGDDFLLLTRHQGIFKVKNGKIEKWNFPAEQELSRTKIFCGIRLQNGGMVLGTISDGLIFLDPQGTITNRIAQRNGLGNNTVLDLFEDVDGNLWAALDNGIDCLNMTSYISEYNNLEGTIGTVYCSIVYEDKLFLGTNQGLFQRPLRSLEPFKLLEGTMGQVWSLSIHDAKLLCGHTNGTYAIRENRVRQISFFNGTWGIKSIPDHPDKLLQGHYSGMSFLKKSAKGDWVYGGTIKGFDNSARFFEILPDNEVWVNHEYKGIYRLKLSKDHTLFTSAELLPNVPKGKNSGLLKDEEGLVYAYKEGIFRFDGQQQIFVKDSSLSELIPKGEYLSGKLIFDEKERLWAFNQNYLAYTEKGLLSGKRLIHKIPIENHWRKTTANFENIHLIYDNTYLIGKTDGYIWVDLNRLKNQKHKIYLNGVTVSTPDGLSSNTSISEEGRFEFDKNSISFEYSVPRYNKYEDVLFQHKLEGQTEHWSEWSTIPVANYTKLPFGNYVFNVRSKIGEQLSDNSARYSFTISRPPYLSNLALLGYLLLLLLLGFVTHKSYNRHYKKQHLKMVMENQRQMELTSIQNEQEIIRLKNEKLNQEIDSKNRELAISTMSMLTRNEVLKGVKKELKKSGLPNTTEVLKLIDKNLNSSKDWDFFKEAFNNSDREFLERIKKVHPNLTHNDLKFCAYLRLNLSSKEIAPLLNITIKSIEIRRYRLRKKMKLPHKTNLTDYILAV